MSRSGAITPLGSWVTGTSRAVALPAGDNCCFLCTLFFSLSRSGASVSSSLTSRFRSSRGANGEPHVNRFSLVLSVSTCSFFTSFTCGGGTDGESPVCRITTAFEWFDSAFDTFRPLSLKLLSSLFSVDSVGGIVLSNGGKVGSLRFWRSSLLPAMRSGGSGERSGDSLKLFGTF